MSNIDFITFLPRLFRQFSSFAALNAKLLRAIYSDLLEESKVDSTETGRK